MLRETAAARRVGSLVLLAIAVGVATLFVLGDRQNLFVRKNRYRILFESVSGLTAGSTVQLNGVKVGAVERVVLPADLGDEQLEVWISVAKRYEQRIRQDSQARIKTLGLLGDKYIELTSGSPRSPTVAEDGTISAAPITDVDRLAEAGEDVVNNIARISTQLTGILGRMEKGEGLLGKLLMDVETGERVTTELDKTMAAVRKLAEGLDDRRGTLGRLVHDRALAEQLAGSLGRLDQLLAKAETGEGILPALLSDTGQKASFDRVLANLDRASEKLADIATALDRGDADALLPKLLHDDEYGERVGEEIAALLTNLRKIAEKINEGDGSAARLVNDETLARAIEDVVIGVNDSRFIKWLIQNRKKKGEAVRKGEAPPDEGAPSESQPHEP